MEEKQESKFIRKSKETIEILRQNNLDFNHLFILECFYYEEDRQFLDIFTIPSLKDLSLSISFQTLKKFEFLVEDPNDTSKIMLSVKGKNFIDSLLQVPNKEFVEYALQMGQPKVTEDQMFDEWWKTFPTTPAWESEDGVKFIGSRHLKNLRKPEAKKKYLKLLNQGLKHEELMGVLRYEIKLKKLDSIKKKENQMDFFKGMESYLNQERYMDFLQAFRDNPDFIKGEEKVRGKRKNVHDI